MTQPVSGMPARPPGSGSSGISATGPLALTMQQRVALERLITRLMALTSQQSAEIWATLRHDLGLKNNVPLLASHFSAAQNNLNQRLVDAQQNQHQRQTLARLSELLSQGNNRQAVSDYIRQFYRQTTLHALTQPQLENVLRLLQSGQLTIPQPQHQQPTLRPLLPAEHNTLNQLVIRLAAATGEPNKLIWQSMLELCGVKSGELIPASHFTPLTWWLQARQTLSSQSAPTLTSLQAALKQPLEGEEWQKIVDFAQASWQVAPKTPLSETQILILLNKVFVQRVARAQDTLPVSPFYPEQPALPATASRRPLLMLAILIALLALLWLAL